MTAQIENTIKALSHNNIKGIYADTKEDVCKIVEDMLFEDCKIASGGSMSLVESGVWDIINRPCFNFADRNRKGITADEQQEVFRGVIGCDFYFCSANALTEKGELVNVDGFANRISAIAFGPKKVIMVVGKNKIVPDLNAAFLRVKTIAAPKNCVRLGIDNPCVSLGKCVSLLKSDNPAMTDGCSSPTRICRNYLVSAAQSIKDRITVIICGEDLGY